MDLASLTAAVCLLLCLYTGPSGAVKEWAYKGHGGQSAWLEMFPECGGQDQSPVDLVTSRMRHEPSLAPLRPLGYNQLSWEPFTLSNNGHTVEMTLPSRMGVAGLPWQFSAVQLHLHWGNGVDMANGSEHTIDGQSASAELHVVHYNSELYANMSEAKSLGNGLAVLGVLIESGEETNHAYANILNYLDHIRHAGQSVVIPAFDVQALLPKDLSRYFHYNGSLTTPPCHQSVLWSVFSERVKVSHSQLLKLETVLFSTTSSEPQPTMLHSNYRTTQPLNHRAVLSSFNTVKVYTAGEISAVIIGSFCGSVGLVVIIRFLVKTARSTSSWDVVPSVWPPQQPRTKDTTKDHKPDLTLNTTSDPGKKAEVHTSV